MSLYITKLWYGTVFLIVKTLLGENFTWTIIGGNAPIAGKKLSFSAVSLAKYLMNIAGIA